MSGGSLAATGASTSATAGSLPTPHISVSPPLESANKIALVDKLVFEANRKSPLTILTIIFFSNKFPAV